MKIASTVILLLAIGLMTGCSTPSSKSPETSDTPAQESPHMDFYSKAFGFGITKPAGWYLIEESVLKEDRNAVRYDNEKLDQIARENPNIPLVVFTRHREPYPTLNPSISVTVSFLPVEGVPPKDALAMSMEISKLAYPDLEVVEPVRDETVAGLQGAYAQMTYTAKFADGKQFPTRVRMWLIPRGKIMFVIGLTGPADESDIFADLYPDILKSIKIETQP